MESGEIHLKIISPEAALLEKRVSTVSLPGKAGRFTVLRNHAPLISSLGKGAVEYSVGEESGNIEIDGGFAEVSDNKVTVCVETRNRK